MTPPTTPVLVYGKTILRTTSQRVQPRPYADSFSTAGTISNTSRITEAMKGMIMMASTRPAVSKPMPIMGPLNSWPMTGTLPKVAFRMGWTWSANRGAKTNRPQMP